MIIVCVVTIFLRSFEATTSYHAVCQWIFVSKEFHCKKKVCYLWVNLRFWEMSNVYFCMLLFGKMEPRRLHHSRRTACKNCLRDAVHTIVDCHIQHLQWNYTDNNWSASLKRKNNANMNFFVNAKTISFQSFSFPFLLWPIRPFMVNSDYNLKLRTNLEYSHFRLGVNRCMSQF